MKLPPGQAGTPELTFACLFEAAVNTYKILFDVKYDSGVNHEVDASAEGEGSAEKLSRIWRRTCRSGKG